MLAIQKIKKILSTFRPLSLLGIFLLMAILVISLTVLLIQLHSKILTTVPGFGGNVSEGIVGSPRFINPVLAVSQSDLDMTSLLYSGLLKSDVDGNITPNLAESYIISEDLLTYTVKLKDDITFHDDVSVTADDVLYTVALVQDASLLSPKKIQWEGVEIKKIDDTTIIFTLKQPYPGFLNTLSIGILPKHIWKDLPIEAIPLSDYNLYPIGSGPYKILNIDKKAGIPSVYNLSAFDDYSLGRPYIDKFKVNIYPNSTDLLLDLEKGNVTNISALNPEKASSLQDKSSLNIIKSVLPRVYGIFWNQSKNPNLVEANVRKALALSVDKKYVVTEAIYGFGIPVNSPIPISFRTESKDASQSEIKSDLVAATVLIEKSGYTKNSATGFFEKIPGNSATELTINITTTGSISEFETTAKILKKTWEELGVRTTIELYELGDLNQKVIKERGYSALLYGTVIQSNSDLYAFWHSSQIKTPGLNLSSYTNTKVDNALQNLRTESDEQKITLNYSSIDQEFAIDMPAALLYSPYFIYITDKKITIPEFKKITNPEDRFENINLWYIKKEYVYTWLANKEILIKIQNYLN